MFSENIWNAILSHVQLRDSGTWPYSSEFHKLMWPESDSFIPPTRRLFDLEKHGSTWKIVASFFQGKRVLERNDMSRAYKFKPVER